MRFVFMLSVSLAGCATGPSIPRYQNYVGAEASCIEGNPHPNFIKLYTEGEAHVWIKEIDGIPTADDSRVCVTPGVHRIGVRAFNRYDYSIVQMDALIEPTRKYEISGNKLGITFFYKLIDISAASANVVLSLSAPITSNASPTYVPIFIPRGR